jgi:3-phenylpropionate/trans-cinnamate dioxygenase ferredoxin component
MSEWIKVCEEKSLKNGDILDFDFEDKQIMVAKAKNKLYALDRICTHAYADLTTGFMNEDEKTVTCPLHMSMFKLEDGSPQNLPAEQPLKKYDVEVRDGWVHVMLK